MVQHASIIFSLNLSVALQVLTIFYPR